MGLVSFWYDVLKPRLYFPTTKRLLIQDWRLGMLFRFLQLMVAVYLLVQIFVLSLYVQIHVPDANLTLFAEDGNQRVDFEQPGQRFIAAEEFCSTQEISKYNYLWSQKFKYEVNGCEGGRSAQSLIEKKLNGGFIPTYEQVTYTFSSPAPPTAVANNQSCMDILNEPAQAAQMDYPTLGLKGCAKRESDTHAPIWRTSDDFNSIKAHHVPSMIPPSQKGDRENLSNSGHCVCQAQRSVFILGVEDLKVILYHSHFLPDQTEGKGYKPPSRIDTHIRIYGTTDDLVVFRDSSKIDMSIRDILNWTAVSLDKPANQGTNAKWFQMSASTDALQGPEGLKLGLVPYLRMTGIKFNIQLSYYNYGKQPQGGSWISRWRGFEAGRTVCIMTLKPVVAWTSTGSSHVKTSPSPGSYVHGTADTFQYGIQLEIEVSGEISSFNFTILVNTLVNAIVLSSAVGILVFWVAKYTMGKEHSAMYREILEEPLNVPEMYKQFAVKSIVASLCYDILDIDRSGAINREELYKALRTIYQYDRDMGPEETSALVEFLMFRASQLNTTASGRSPSVDVEKAGKKKGGKRGKKKGVKGSGSDVTDTDLDVSSDTADVRALAALGDELRSSKGNAQRRKSVMDKMVAQMRVVSLKRRRRYAAARFIGRAEFVTAYTGKPCTVSGFTRLVKRKRSQGHYSLPEVEREAYLEMEERHLEDVVFRKRLSQIHGGDPAHVAAISDPASIGAISDDSLNPSRMEYLYRVANGGGSGNFDSMDLVSPSADSAPAKSVRFADACVDDLETKVAKRLGSIRRAQTSVRAASGTMPDSQRVISFKIPEGPEAEDADEREQDEEEDSSEGIEITVELDTLKPAEGYTPPELESNTLCTHHLDT